MNDQTRLNSLESQISSLAKEQRNFTSKALQLLALGAKSIYSKEEAALFLNLEPQYLYQLKHHGKLKAYKKKGQKKIYFKKEDLESYLLGESTEEIEVDEYQDFEDEILQNWKK